MSDEERVTTCDVINLATLAKAALYEDLSSDANEPATCDIITCDIIILEELSDEDLSELLGDDLRPLLEDAISFVEALLAPDVRSDANVSVSHQSKVEATEWVRKLRLVHNVRPPSCSDSLRQPNSIETAYSLDCS